jgi:hypothetical protein
MPQLPSPPVLKNAGPLPSAQQIVVEKTPQAIFLQHGTGRATIRSQPIPYCGGEVGRLGWS